MPPDSLIRLKRLEALADLWGKVYLFHPAIVSAGQPLFSATESRDRPGLDWHRALIQAIPRVEAAESPDELAAAVNDALLRPLGDLLTFACVQAASPKPQAAGRDLVARRLTDSVGYV